MAAPKRFSARRNDAEPKPFVLEFQREVPREGDEGGYDLHDEEASFTAVAVANAGALLDAAEKVEPETGARPAAALIQFMRDVLVADDVERFETLVHDKAVRIDVQVIGEVCEWLMGEYTSRPTLPR